MLEVEAKVAVPELEGVRGRLRSLGARGGPVEEQEDLFFRHPSRDFARTDEALRLRRAGGRLELTYKGPRAGGPAKVRPEETLALAADPTPLLRGLGFAPAFRLRKRREPWRFGAVEVALDDVPGLGAFVEVEAAPGAPDAEGEVARALAALGLGGRPREGRSYLELALAAGAAGVERE